MLRRYLSLCSLREALDRMMCAFPPPDNSERIPLGQSVGRVTSEAVYAEYPVPEVNIAAMDGIAVKSRDTVGATETRPVTFTNFAYVNTGRIVPPCYDSVIMIEDTWMEGDTCRIRKSAAPWQHVRHAGEDIKSGELIIPKGHQVRPFDVGALATYGIARLNVRSVRVGIIPTGSELVGLGNRPAPGQVVESNSLLAEAYLNGMGATCKRYPIVPDDPELIKYTVLTAISENDAVLISAGSSAGTKDFTPDVLASLGDMIFHGVAIKPGKPVMLARIKEKPVLGMPGYPLAAQTVLREFAAPLLAWWGLAPLPDTTVPVRLAQTMTSELGYDEFVPVSVGKVNGQNWAVPNPRGSGIQMAVVRANGYIHLPAALEGIETGSEVRAHLTVSPHVLDRSLLFVGVRDPALDELTDLAVERGISLHCCNAGNIEGILSVVRGSCHVAPISIPSVSEGFDNPYFRYVRSIDITRVHIGEIQQGIASREGLSFEQLKSASFLNRQKGSTARLLFDELLRQRGISPDEIDGYSIEMKSHQAIASAICNGYADAGVCSSSVAKAFGLAFVPLAHESYELMIPTGMIEQERIRDLLEVIRSRSYHERLEKIGGFSIRNIGSMVRMPGINEREKVVSPEGMHSL